MPRGRGYQGDAQSKQLLSYKLVFIPYFSLLFTMELAQFAGICFLAPNTWFGVQALLALEEVMAKKLYIE